PPLHPRHLHSFPTRRSSDLLPNGRRIPGLKLDQPRQLALMHSLVRFCYLAAEGTFTTRDLYPQTLQALQVTPEEYKKRTRECMRSEEHTSELQSRGHLVCRL